MAKPKLSVIAPPALFAGSEHVIELEIDPDEGMTVDYVDAHLRGIQGWEFGFGNSREANEEFEPYLDVRLMERGILPAGKPTRFAVRFKLPPDMPPSHAIDPAYARFELRVRIGVPWWFDVKYRYLLPVRRPLTSAVVRTPIVARSRAPQGDEPRIELALASTCLVAGEQLTGSVAVFHYPDGEPRDVKLHLIPKLALHGRNLRFRPGHGFAFAVTIPAGGGGSSVPFVLQLPAALTPNFAAQTHTLSWTLEAIAVSGGFFGGSISTSAKLEIVDRAAETTPRLTQAPQLGDARVAALFSQFALEAGWETSQLQDEDRAAIERDVGDNGLRITYVYRDEGTFLISRVVGRSLGLGLSVTPSSAIRHVFWKDIEVDIDAWDRAHHVSARFPDQALPALLSVVPALAKPHPLGKLVGWTDDDIVFERPSPDPETGDLASIAPALEALAALLDVARATIAPPPNVTVDLVKWHELARWLDGTLVPGDLSITGKLGLSSVELWLEFEEDSRMPLAVYAIAGNREVSAEVAAVTLSVPHPAIERPVTVPDVLIEPLSRWPIDFVGLDVRGGIASARWRLPPAGDAPLPLDASRARDLIVQLTGVLAAVDPGRGPYR